MADVRVDFDDRDLRALAADPEVGREMARIAAPIVREAQTRAPRLTGAGASSIRADQVVERGEQEVHICWDRDHYYMAFHEFGTRYLPARPFLEPTVEGFR